jgi:hypothetical protein
MHVAAGTLLACGVSATIIVLLFPLFGSMAFVSVIEHLIVFPKLYEELKPNFVPELLIGKKTASFWPVQTGLIPVTVTDCKVKSVPVKF